MSSYERNGVVISMVMVLDGKALAADIKLDLKDRVALLRAQGKTVSLATVLVGNDPASQKYVNGKHRDCAEVGIQSVRVELPASATTQDVLTEVERLNNDDYIDGYIVQLPLPVQVDETQVMTAIDPRKDADGLSPASLGALVLNVDGADTNLPVPCTPAGVLRLLEANDISLKGKNVCVIGRGLTIGRTIGLMLTTRAVNATVDLCHTGTVDLTAHTRDADVIIACAGSAGLIKPSMLNTHGGVVLVDVGVTRKTDYETGKSKIYGDVNHSCYTDPRVMAYTPNPGGVGPMTRAMLLENVVRAAESSVKVKNQ